MDSKLLRRLREFLETPGRKILFYHHDADGICSAALLLEAFPGFEILGREGPRLEPEFLKSLEEKKPSLLLFLDIPVDQEWKSLRQLQKKIPGLKMVIIDHHLITRNMNSKDTIHINPRLEKDIYLPASCLVYRIIEMLKPEVSERIWVAAIGIIGDYGFKQCHKIMQECRKAYPRLLKGPVMKSQLAKGAEMISNAITLKGLKGSSKALSALREAVNFKEFLSNPKLKSWSQAAAGEINRVLEGFKSGKQEVPDKNLVIYIIESPMNITAVISSHLAVKHPSKIIMVAKEARGDTVRVSTRCQNGTVNLGGLMSRASKGIGMGGGHRQAAGAKVSDFELFKKRFLRLL